MCSDRSNRFLAMWFPHLPTDRLKRESPARALTDQHLIVVDKIANALRLTAVDEQAAKAGLYKGMALTDARAQFDKLDIAFASPRKDGELLEKLADWCDRYTPLVALDAPHGLILDMTGCIHLFGDEPTLLEDVHRQLQRHGMIVKTALPAMRQRQARSPGILRAVSSSPQTRAGGFMRFLLSASISKTHILPVSGVPACAPSVILMFCRVQP